MPLCFSEPYILRGEWCGHPGTTAEVVWATKQIFYMKICVLSVKIIKLLREIKVNSINVIVLSS
jgi:hypothetical protein